MSTPLRGIVMGTITRCGSVVVLGVSLVFLADTRAQRQPPAPAEGPGAGLKKLLDAKDREGSRQVPRRADAGRAPGRGVRVRAGQGGRAGGEGTARETARRLRRRRPRRLAQ